MNTLEQIKRYLEELFPYETEVVVKQIKNGSFKTLNELVAEDCIEVLNGPERICRDKRDGRELVDNKDGTMSIVPPFRREKHNTHDSAYRSATVYCNQYGGEIVSSDETINSTTAAEYSSAGDWTKGYIDGGLKLLFVINKKLEYNNPVAIFAYRHRY